MVTPSYGLLFNELDDHLLHYFKMAPFLEVLMSEYHSSRNFKAHTLQCQVHFIVSHLEQHSSY